MLKKNIQEMRKKPKKLIVHLMGINNSFDQSLINFIQKNDTLKESKKHVFIINSLKNVLKVQNKKQSFFNHLKLINYYLKKADIILMHGFFLVFKSLKLLIVSLFMAYFLKKSKKTQKILWVIWGGDIYNDFLENSIRKTKLQKIIRKVTRAIGLYLKRNFVKKLSGVVVLVPGDYKIFKKIYKIDLKRYHVFYPNPINYDILDKEKNTKEKYFFLNEDDYVLLLGNSASETNNHIEVIDFFSSLVGESKKLKIICPLSYGNLNYARKIINYGQSKLKDSFLPLVDFLNPEEYARILNSIRVAVFNHSRQQALGNILALLYLEKKVYIRKNVSTYVWLKKLNITIFDTENLLKEKSITNIFNIRHETLSKNREIIKRYFSEENCTQLWENVFNCV